MELAIWVPALHPNFEGALPFFLILPLATVKPPSPSPQPGTWYSAGLGVIASAVAVSVRAAAPPTRAASLRCDTWSSFSWGTARRYACPRADVNPLFWAIRRQP